MSLSARTVRAGRTRRPRARLRVQIRRNNAADESNRNRFARVPMFPGRNVAFLRSRSCRRTIAPFMLAPCSASSMLFASLRPGRRPGLRALTTPPRGTSSGSYAMVVSMMTTRTRLTRESRRRMLALSRQCRTALPPFAPTANGARIRSAPSGHGIERNPHRIAVRCTTTEDGWSARL